MSTDMTDLDLVLERLIADPNFASMLQRDRDGALRRYRLSADELQLLSAYVIGDDRAIDARVEPRHSKAGLLSLVGSMLEGVSPPTFTKEGSP